MSILTRQLSWPAWRFGVLKFSMLAFGILVGSSFTEFWQQWQVALWAAFGLTAIVTTVWGLQAILPAESKTTTPEKRTA